MDLTLQDARKWIEEELSSAGIDEYRSEAFWILERATGIGRAGYYMDPDQTLSREAESRIRDMAGRRRTREPLAYIFRECEFMGFSFYVDERVLIPRQDTEILVETAIDAIKKDPAPRVLDLCCGSGCIGLSIAKLCPRARVTLSDKFSGAVTVTEENAARLGAEVEVVRGDLFENICGKYDYIISNPPYIPSGVIGGLMEEVRAHEPGTALDGGRDGLDFYRRIIREAGDHLAGGGKLLFEIGCDQGEDLYRMMTGAGYDRVEVLKDLNGLDRVVRGNYKEEYDV